MVIKFYCKCGKKVSVPDSERNMEGVCPRCGEVVSLKDADPTTIEREPLQVIDIDGARVLFEDGWGLVRASNTQPALVLRFEALSESRLSEIRNLVESAVAEIRDD